MHAHAVPASASALNFGPSTGRRQKMSASRVALGPPSCLFHLDETSLRILALPSRSTRPSSFTSIFEEEDETRENFSFPCNETLLNFFFPCMTQLETSLNKASNWRFQERERGDATSELWPLTFVFHRAELNPFEVSLLVSLRVKSPCFPSLEGETGSEASSLAPRVPRRLPERARGTLSLLRHLLQSAS